MKYLRFQANRKPCSGCSQQIPSPHCWTQSSVPGGCRMHCCLPKGCTHLLQGVLIVLLSLSLSNKWDPVFFPGLHGWECWAFTWVGVLGRLSWVQLQWELCDHLLCLSMGSDIIQGLSFELNHDAHFIFSEKKKYMLSGIFLKIQFIIYLLFVADHV